MTEITRDELLALVSVTQAGDGSWQVAAVRGNVGGNVGSNVFGDVGGNVRGNVLGSVKRKVISKTKKNK